MPRNVFEKTLEDRRVSIVGWVVGAAALTGFVVSVYPVLANSTDMQDFMAQIPEGMMAIFGMDPATFLTGAGFLQAQMYSLIGPIMIIGIGVTAAAGVTANEERTRTMDLLLSMPLSRTSVMVHKTATVLVSAFLVVAALAITIAVANPIVDLKLSVEGIVAVNIGLLGLGVFYAATALAIGAFTGKASTALGATMALAVLGWFVNGFSGIFTWLEIPAKFSPFSWYLDGAPLINGAPSGFAWLWLSAVAVTGLAVFLFNRRDISTEASVVPEAAKRRKRHRVSAPRSIWLLESVFRSTLWDRRVTIFGWGGGLATVLLATYAAWPALSADPDALSGLVNAIPRDLLALMGIADPTYLATAAGFVSSRTYQSIGPVVIIVFAMGAVSASVIREEGRGTLDLVLSTATRRRSLLAGKAIGIGVLTMVITGILLVVGIISNLVWSTEIALADMLAANVGLTVLGLFFGGLALALWSLLSSGGSAIGITAGIAVASYLLNGVGSLVDGLSGARSLSPFYWYMGDVPPLSHGLSVGYLLLGIGAVAFVALAIWRFESRDLAT